MNGVNLESVQNQAIYLCTLSTSENTWHIAGAQWSYAEGRSAPKGGATLLFKGCRLPAGPGSWAALGWAVDKGRGTRISVPPTIYQRDAYPCSSSTQHFSTASAVSPHSLFMPVALVQLFCTQKYLSLEEKLLGSFFTNPIYSRFSNCAPWVQ